MPSGQQTHSILRAAAGAHEPRPARRGQARAGALLAAAVVVVLVSAAWIVGLHLRAAHAHERAERLNAAAAQLDGVQMLVWRGIAGDVGPQTALVQGTVRWRAFRD